MFSIAKPNNSLARMNEIKYGFLGHLCADILFRVGFEPTIFDFSGFNHCTSDLATFNVLYVQVMKRPLREDII